MSTRLVTLALVSAMVASTIYAQQSDRRVDLTAGQSAPFAGTLLSDAALGELWNEIDALRDERDALRQALAAQERATAAADLRAEMWEASARGGGFNRFASGVAKYGLVGCLGVGIGAWASGR